MRNREFSASSPLAPLVGFIRPTQKQFQGYDVLLVEANATESCLHALIPSITSRDKQLSRNNSEIQDIQAQIVPHKQTLQKKLPPLPSTFLKQCFLFLMNALV